MVCESVYFCCDEPVAGRPRRGFLLSAVSADTVRGQARPLSDDNSLPIGPFLQLLATGTALAVLWQ